MKKNVLLIIGIFALVVSGILTAFTDIGNDIPGIVGMAFGLGLLVIGTWNKSEKKNGWTLASIICAIIGGFSCAIAGLSKEMTTTVITTIIAAVSIIASILIPVITTKKQLK